MGKKIRIEAVIETNGDLFVDDSLLKRTINSLGEVISCNINNNYDDSKPEINKAKELQTDSSSFSDISHLSKNLTIFSNVLTKPQIPFKL